MPSGNLHVKAYLWKPTGSGPFPFVLFNQRSGGADAAHTGGMPITETAERLAPFFLQHGHALLYLFRRGQGLSADQAPFLQDVLEREEADGKNLGSTCKTYWRERLLNAVRSTAVPVMLFYPVNDYDTAPGIALAAELVRQHKSHALKIYPPVGQSNDDGHNMMWMASSLWEDDLFKFLDEHMMR